MYNTKKLTPSLDNILDKVTEYDIYNYYTNGGIKVGRIMHSPFRKDKTPSFGVFKGSNGRLLFKDHGTGDSGDVVVFVSKLHNLTYTKALQRIQQDIINTNISISTTGINIQEHYENTKNIISVQRKNFTETDDKYWNRYTICRDTLKYYNVYPIQYFWINDNIATPSYTKECPMYAYQIYLKFKIYRPLAPKKYKWFSNCGLYDLQGYEQLPYQGDLLIITKSLKDVMVLYQLGYNAIAPQGEGHSLPKIVIDDITKRFTNIILLYDNDNAGREAVTKLHAKHAYNYIFTPDDSGVKDISDYIEKYGVEQTKEFLYEQLDFIKRKVT